MLQPSLASRFLASLLALFLTLGAPAQASQGAGLPRLASTALPAPEAASVAEVDAALAQVASASIEERDAGMRRLREGGAAFVPAMAKRIADARKSLDRDAVGRLLDEARKRGRESTRKTSSSKSADGSSNRKKHDEKSKSPRDDANRDAEGDISTAGDWLTLLTADPRPKEAPYRDAIAVLAIARALTDVGTTAAAREIIAVYASFGDLFRIDVQRRLAALGDRAVPALLEAKKHDIEKVRRWASRELDRLGKAIPGEAVQIADPQVLADVLRAFGRTKDIDALRVVVSFAASDRLQVRDAAREAVTSYGEAAVWQLREAYETFTGNRMPAGSSWDRIASELYAAHDRARLAEVYALFEQGLAKQKAGDHAAAVESFDRALARAPGFERRAEMVLSYAALARGAARDDVPRALLLARKALRIDPDGLEAKSLASLVLTLEGESLVTHGLADALPFRRALDADPANERARSDLLRVEAGDRGTFSTLYRYVAAAIIGLVAIATAFVIGARRPRDESDAPGHVPP